MRRAPAVAVVLISLVVLGAVGWVTLNHDGGVSDRQVDAYGPAIEEWVAAEPPAVALPEPINSPSAAAAPSTLTAPLASGIPVPEPSLIPVRSGSLASLQADPLPRPVGLRIGAISLQAPIEPVGYDRGRDEMEVPRSREIVGWYEHGPTPGQPGSAVLAAHVDWNRKPGAFFRLPEVQPGTRIVVEFSDGSERHFRAESLRQYEKPELPVDRLFAKDGPTVLTLITCGGSFDRAERSYQENVVLQAVEVPPPSPPPPSA